MVLNTTIPLMQKFTYRTPRFPVDLPIRLTVDERTFHARCREISRDGMQLEIEQPLGLSTRGIAAIACGGFALEIAVEVSHSGPSQEGVKFIFSSDSQRSDVARLVAILAAEPRPSGLRLVK